MRNNRLVSLVACMIIMSLGVASAAVKKKETVKKQSAIQSGTTVRTRIEPVGLFDKECYDLYYGCMDQFCITDNENGGSCSCSDLSFEYEKQLNEIKDLLQEAERISTIEVEKASLGAQADIVFTGTREYDEEGNIKEIDEIGKDKKSNLLALWDSVEEEEDDEWDYSDLDFASLRGGELYSAAQRLCLDEMPEKCDEDIRFLKNIYSRQITSDCNAYKNTLAKKKAEADIAKASAESELRAALKESFESANKYDLGQCMVEFRKCMQTEDACGKDWEHCVSIVADLNMQNNETKSTVGTKKAEEETFDITESTLDVLGSKRVICENVLSSCVAVRDLVWPAFLKEAAPTIRVAEDYVESRFRQSCLTNISQCIQKACKDDIVGKGVDTMDACLSRPEMVRSFCKVEIDPCERMEPLIWGYVQDKLAAMRVDACTQEVKDCFTNENRCGADFQNCIGMDYDYIHDICPVDSLVVCKANNPGFSMDDLDSMLMGLYLNVDNSFLEQCQELVDTKMAEICGSTTDCNRFAADDTLGTGSLQSQKDGTVYRVTGMISFGSIQMGDAAGTVVETYLDEYGDEVKKKLKPGELGVKQYIAEVRKKFGRQDGADLIIDTIEHELNNIAGTINRTIEMIEQDPEIQFCINGRDLSQITGKKEKTSGRFPNLVNQIRMQIAIAALRQAQNNYNTKFNKAIAEASKNASLDFAQYMCHKMAEVEATTLKSPNVDLAPPYAISYEVGSGLGAEDLTASGHGTAKLGEVKFKNGGYLGGSSSDLSSGVKETTALFSRETRTCHICTNIMTTSCKTTGSSSWFHNSRNMECKTEMPVDRCEDILM